MANTWTTYSELSQSNKRLVQIKYKGPFVGWMYRIGRDGFVDWNTHRKRPPSGWMKVGKYGAYTMWRRKEAGRAIYNVTKNGKSPGENAGGYYSKEAILRLKGVNAR